VRRDGELERVMSGSEHCEEWKRNDVGRRDRETGRRRLSGDLWQRRAAFGTLY